MIRTCIFPVAGLGTRFLPATKSIPKEMLVVVDKPLIQYAVEEAREAGIERFVFVTSQGKSAIEDHFDSHLSLEAVLRERQQNKALKRVQEMNLKIGEAIYIRQPKPLGLGHAIYCARHFVNEDSFAVILADDLIQNETSCLKQMMQHYKESTQMVATQDVGMENISRYGCLSLVGDNPLYSVSEIVEKPPISKAMSSFAVVGRYILPSTIFKTLEKHITGEGGEIQITDAISSLMSAHPLYALAFEGRKYDCGTRDGWLKANLSYALKDPVLRQEMQSFLKDLI
jgi:UTP--glucose-1-phosphate uridylyltransferase